MSLFQNFARIDIKYILTLQWQQYQLKKSDKHSS